MSPPTLLHLCSPGEWRSALAVGAIGLAGAAAQSMTDAGFVHLSTPEQVTLPADRLFAGRTDLVLLAVDAGRIRDLRWEPGVPGDPGSMVFPHAYGPIPADAVVAVTAYRPRADGGFDAPLAPPTRIDAPGRHGALADSLPRRAATAEEPVAGGVAVLTDPVATSRRHNQLLVHGPIGAAQVAADADRVLGGAGRAHRAVTLSGTGAAATAAELGRRGWQVTQLSAMAAAPTGVVAADLDGPQPERVLLSDLHALREAVLDHAEPGATAARRAAPALHAELTDRVVDVHALAIREHGELIACCLLAVDGATAELDVVETHPAHRGRGLGDALLTGALREAARAGCDLVVLDASTGTGTHAWYRRRGFGEVGQRWRATLAGPGVS